MSDLIMPRHLCPKCGKPYKWIMTKEPICQLVVFRFKCLGCGTLWEMEKGGTENG